MEEIKKRLAECEHRITDLEHHAKVLYEDRDAPRRKAREEGIASLAVQIREALKEFDKLKRDVRIIKTEIKRQRFAPLRGPW